MSWVRLDRSLTNHPIWVRERFTRGQAWVDLILRASYKDHVALQGSRPIQVKRGQVLTSQVDLAARWKWDRETVHRFLQALESLKMATTETSKATDTGYTLITLTNYDTYQGDGLSDPVSDAPSDPPLPPASDPASMPHPCPTIKKGKKMKNVVAGDSTPIASGLTLNEYLTKFPPEGQAILRKVVDAIASTRKAGEVSQSVLDSLAKKLDSYPAQGVLSACRIYLSKNYAAQRRGESYLLGIVRREAKSGNGNGREPFSPSAEQIPQTQAQLVIERAKAERRRELEVSR